MPIVVSGMCEAITMFKKFIEGCNPLLMGIVQLQDGNLQVKIQIR
jgi:hypothetical protein